MRERVDRVSWQPKQLSLTEANDLASRRSELVIVDRYEEQLEEVFQLRNPKTRFNPDYRTPLADFTKNHCAGKSLDEAGAWFYFPWRNTLIHFLREDLHTELRTGRNRNLITNDEQQHYYNARAAILGMSVGSHAALVLTMNGGPKHLKLADMDTISGANTNRIRTGFHDVGIPKIVSVARQIYEINPYADIAIYPRGAEETNLESIISDPKLDILIEEMDNPYFKFKTREYCKKHSVALVSAADNGDGIIAHIERYDSNPKQDFFNGLMGSITAEEIKKLDKQKIIGVIARTVGADRSVLRMQESVMEVGKSLYSWPQLGTAANMCGSALTYLARRIILREQKIKSGIYDISLDGIFESDYLEEKNKTKRTEDTKKFMEMLGIK